MGACPRPEPPLLIEHGVVGEEALGHRPHHSSTGCHHRCVDELAAPGIGRLLERACRDSIGGQHRADHRRTATSCGGDHLCQGDLGVCDEALLEQEVLWWVARDGELREQDKIDAAHRGLLDRPDRRSGVGRKIANGRVNLGGRHSDRAHQRSLTTPRSGTLPARATITEPRRVHTPFTCQRCVVCDRQAQWRWT